MQMLNTILDEVEKDEFCKGLMYVRYSINRNPMMALVDSRATHNFMDSTMKTINAEVLTAHGEVKGATLWIDC